MGNIIGAIILSIIAIVCFVLSYLQFKERGFLFNNAYIYASRQERETLDKKPYFKQSGIVFALIGLIFLINAIDMIIQTGWLFYLVIGIAIVVIVYAIVSSFVIEKRKSEFDGVEMQNKSEFWKALDELVNNSEIIIDRPKGTAHPKYPDFIYRVDYGYLCNTSSMDGAGIDVWVGSGEKKIDAIMCIVDLMKRDSEIKILIGCTEEEKSIVYETHNETQFMKGILIRR